MLTRAQVAEAERLLAGGASQRAVAARLGVNRRTVGKVKRGEHPLQLTAVDPKAHRWLGPLRDRRTRAAALRRLAAGGRLSPRQIQRFLRAAGELLAAEPLGVRLTGGRRKRYEAVAAARRALERRLGNLGRTIDVALAPRDGVN